MIQEKNDLSAAETKPGGSIGTNAGVTNAGGADATDSNGVVWPDDDEDSGKRYEPGSGKEAFKAERRLFREQVFILLFLTGFYEKAEREPQARLYLEGTNLPEEMQERIVARYTEVARKIGQIDPMISKASQGWNLHRIGKAELNILRVAIYEMYFDEAIPVSVAINEAVELARTYGGDQSHAFVNGILSSVLRNNPVN